MSFSHQQKKEITDQHYKSACCRRSLLYGILFAKGRIDNDGVVITLENVEYAEYTAKLVKEFFGSDARLFRSEKGGRCVMLSFSSSAAGAYIDSLSNDGAELVIQKCANCLSSFLRGVFLASGRVADPQKQYSLEFTLRDRCTAFADFLRELSLSPLISRRSTGDMVYFRNSEEIENFYGYAGLNKAVFNLIEIKINTLARRETQRFMNCVSNNHNKMLDVADRQIGIIRKLDSLNLLSSLPDELENTARMRMEYADLPLSALAQKMTPAISKSGLSHRLKHIEEIAKKLLDNEG